MVNKSKFQREFFDILITSKGFFVEEIGDEDDSLWIAMKTLENGDVHSIIISDKESIQKNKDKAYKYLKEREIKFSLYNIVIFNEKLQEKSIDFKGYNDILVDLHSKKIYGLKDEELFLEQIINSILKEKCRSKSNLHKNFKINEFTKSLILISITILCIIFLVILFIEKDNIHIFFNSTPNRIYNILETKYWIIINSEKYYGIIKYIFAQDGIINLTIFLYILYIIIGIIDSFENKNKCIAVYLICGFFSGLFNFFFIPNVSITPLITGVILGILGLTLLFSMRERKTLGNGVLINIIVILFVYFLIGTPDSFSYYISHLLDITIGFSVGIMLYKYNYLKRSFL